jgi:S-disulfanyl-L-cysteine oxidoreductase SoxD
MTRSPWLVGVGAVYLASSVAIASGRVDVQDTSVWRGVFTTAQADRGKAVYASHCSRCHGTDLAGTRASALAGERFMDQWEAHTLEHLFRRIRDAMPPGDERSVTDADKRDALAYVLQQNGFPAGSNELAIDDGELARVQITRQTGPGPLKTGALVRVAGCLAQRGDGGWELNSATEPERTALDAVPAAGSQPSAANLRGTRTVRLLNPYPSPVAHLGRMMQAIGFLVRDAAADAVNVVTLEMVAPICAR